MNSKKIDDFKFENIISFIKIDVEGHEFKVLEGGMNFINKHKVKLIQIEFNIHHLTAESLAQTNRTI